MSASADSLCDHVIVKSGKMGWLWSDQHSERGTRWPLQCCGFSRFLFWRHTHTHTQTHTGLLVACDDSNRGVSTLICATVALVLHCLLSQRQGPLSIFRLFVYLVSRLSLKLEGENNCSLVLACALYTTTASFSIITHVIVFLPVYVAGGVCVGVVGFLIAMWNNGLAAAQHCSWHQIVSSEPCWDLVFCKETWKQRIQQFNKTDFTVNVEKEQLAFNSFTFASVSFLVKP